MIRRVMLLCTAVAGLIAAGGLAPPSQAASPDPLAGIVETSLPNGLKLLTKEIRSAPVVTIWTWYRTGSRNERPGVTGLSHLLEHMMFRATTSLRQGEIDRLIQRAGGRHNAFTGYDATAYHITLPSDQLEVGLRIEAERMQNCLLDVEDVTREKGVVLSELQGRRNDPEELLEEATRTAAFQVHPYGTPIIGWKQDVASIRQETILDYYRTYYQPNNAVLVIVGDFETQALLALIRKYFGAMYPAPPPPGVAKSEPPQERERRVTVKGAGSTGYLQILYRLPAASHPDLYALEVADALLTAGKSSRLSRALLESGLAAAQASYLARRIDPGWLSFYLTAREGVPLARIERTFDGALARLRAEPVEKVELDRAVNQVRAGHIFQHGSVSGLARVIGTLETTVGHRAIGEYLDRIRQVTAADVQRVARTYFTAETRTVGWFVPESSEPEPGPTGPPAPAAPRGASHGSHASPPHAPAPSAGPESASPLTISSAVSAPASRVVRAVLANGLTLIAAENRLARAVAIQGYVLAGPVVEPPGKAGLAHLTASLLTRGSTLHDAEKLDEWLEYLGATAEFRSGYETVGIQAQALSEHFETVLDYLAECLRAPSFPADELAKAAGRQRSRLLRDAEDVKDRAHRELFARLYPSDHPLHRHPRGRLPDLAGITREDVVAFHGRHYRPDRSVLVIVGDRTPEEILAQVQRAFGGWTRSPGPAAALPPSMPRLPQAMRHTVTLPGKSEAFIMLGGNGIARDHPDFYAAYLATRILGGGLGSRLMRALREDGGMTYGVFAYFYPFLGERPWIVSLQTAPRDVDRAVSLALAEVRRLRETGVTADELERAKASAVGLLTLSLEDQNGQAVMLRDAELFGLGLEFPQRYAEGIRAVTAEQLLAASRAYLDPDRLVRIVVTPPQP